MGWARPPRCASLLRQPVQPRAIRVVRLCVHCFDLAAGTWSYLTISKKPCTRAMLLPEPDGRGVVAFYDPYASWVHAVSENGNPVSAWRWRSGAWTQIPLPDDVARHIVAGAAASADGIWLDIDDYLRLAGNRQAQECESYMKFVAYDGRQLFLPGDQAKGALPRLQQVWCDGP
jgi:hypothetical protein